MLKDATTKLPNDALSFSISTKIPNSWLINEERLWDEKFSRCESIKNFINRKIVAAIAKTTGKKYKTENADCYIVFDFNNFTINIERAPLFIFGRYKKYSKELSQSRWICKKCKGEGCFKCDYTGKNYTSVEELIGQVFKEATECDDYVMHASGREDIDVINIAGRPFVLEIKNPKKRKIDLDEIAKRVSNENIAVCDLKFVKAETVELVANSHFDKAYEAVLSFKNEIDEEEMKRIKEKIEALSGCIIDQRTPTRVVHRRADLIRKRKILEIKVFEYDKKNIKIVITAEAGTYIKEFISGDKGRTTPSIAETLGMNLKCEELKVIAIHDDFLKVRGL
jgi:tRNA pseudouridine synthase 10